MSDAPRYAWACSVFGLQPGASPQEVRAAVMSHLDDADFVPPDGWRQAIRLLCDPQAPQAGPRSGYDAFREAQENSLAEEVDQFAAQFFALPRGPRRAKWTQLLTQATGFPRLIARLRSLQPGLDAESATPQGQTQQDSILVDRVRRLFVLKPGAQDLQRRQWLAAMTGDWRPVVRRVRAKHPKLAQLDADFLSALESSHHGAAAVKPSLALAANTNLAAAFISVPKTAAAGASPARTTTTSGSGSSTRSSVWPVIGVLALLGGLLRGAIDSSSNSYSPPYKPPPPPISREQMDAIVKTMQAAGKLPNGSPNSWPSGSLDPRVPSSKDNADEAWIREYLSQRPPPNGGPPSSPPFWRDTPPNANAGDGASKGPASPSAPAASMRPPSHPSPIRAGPASPAVPGGSPR